MIERGIAGFGLVWFGLVRGVGRDTLYVICSQYMKRYIWIECPMCFVWMSVPT